ncbi:hypothetical protein SBI_09941 [Streptomyces bingchenggensis BCW-1]|uniref:Glycosyl hydrolase family 95 N-terminal domain-containing protein n=1 Tax=Streptomyces bingchenggensis (strain BCW-1) TaxID=749414 RepID=D7CF43_STRBB|nr:MULTISPECIES: glycoside hydrolase N-terminal domain-containing protein [Streptomyces]ADI13059.1 hypothetical protein SBI_09941 [Streptomyces bingchenggensis BCW-1]
MHSAHPPEGGTAAPGPAKVALPERGIHDTAPAQLWTDGFLAGNGEYGAVVYGDLALEKVVFNHHRLVLANGTRDLAPPVLAERLEAVRDKALAGDYAGASRDFAAGWELRWTQTYHPAYELRIAAAHDTVADRYVRITDFRTGEVTAAWTDGHGTWSRRIFVSRADRVIVHELAPAPGRTVDVTLSVHTALDDTPTVHSGRLAPARDQPGGAARPGTPSTQSARTARRPEPLRTRQPAPRLGRRTAQGRCQGIRQPPEDHRQ